MSYLQLVLTYGYLLVFLVVGLESVGIPLPGETILIVAGTYAGTSHKLSGWLIFVAAAAGAIIGDNIGYWIGNTGGYRLLRRWGHYIRVDEARMKVGRYVFDQHGGKVVFFGRFVSVLRTYAAFLAGTARMKWPRFLGYNAAGGLLWAGVYTAAAYWAGGTLTRFSGTVNIILGLVAGLVILVSLVYVRRRIDGLVERAEAAYPGPLQ